MFISMSKRPEGGGSVWILWTACMPRLENCWCAEITHGTLPCWRKAPGHWRQLINRNLIYMYDFLLWFLKSLYTPEKKKQSWTNSFCYSRQVLVYIHWIHFHTKTFLNYCSVCMLFFSTSPSFFGLRVILDQHFHFQTLLAFRFLPLLEIYWAFVGFISEIYYFSNNADNVKPQVHKWLYQLDPTTLLAISINLKIYRPEVQCGKA